MKRTRECIIQVLWAKEQSVITNTHTPQKSPGKYRQFFFFRTEVSPTPYLRKLGCKKEIVGILFDHSDDDAFERLFPFHIWARDPLSLKKDGDCRRDYLFSLVRTNTSLLFESLTSVVLSDDFIGEMMEKEDVYLARRRKVLSGLKELHDDAFITKYAGANSDFSVLLFSLFNSPSHCGFQHELWKSLSDLSSNHTLMQFMMQFSL